MKSWFRCTHKKTSLPVTRRRKDAGERDAQRRANTYVICLNCGEQIPYSFTENRVVAERRKSRTQDPAVSGLRSLA
jgi:hypothetical protein